MLLGVWKNVEDLEEHLSLPELELVLSAGRDKEYRQNRFLAAINNIDLDDSEKINAKEKFDEIQRRVEARRTGASEQQLEMDIFGIEVETEE